MRNSTKLKTALFAPLLLSAALFMPSIASAGSCGSGYVTEINEGGWSQQGLLLKIDYSFGQSAHVGTEFYGHLRYDTTLGDEKLDAIRALVMVAFTSGIRVKTFSHSSDCSAVSELTLVAE